MAPIRSVGIDRLETGAVALTLFSKVSGGPADGQESTLFFDDVGAGRILAALARIPAYRDVFAAIANELDRRESASRASSTARITEPPESDTRLRAIIMEVMAATMEGM